MLDLNSFLTIFTILVTLDDEGELIERGQYLVSGLFVWWWRKLILRTSFGVSLSVPTLRYGNPVTLIWIAMHTP